MKLNRLLTLYCALSMALGMVTFASAADYSFKTSPDPVYYGSTNYEDLYDCLLYTSDAADDNRNV